MRLRLCGPSNNRESSLSNNSSVNSSADGSKECVARWPCRSLRHVIDSFTVNTSDSVRDGEGQDWDWEEGGGGRKENNTVGVGGATTTSTAMAMLLSDNDDFDWDGEGGGEHEAAAAAYDNSNSDSSDSSDSSGTSDDSDSDDSSDTDDSNTDSSSSSDSEEEDKETEEGELENSTGDPISKKRMRSKMTKNEKKKKKKDMEKRKKKEKKKDKKMKMKNNPLSLRIDNGGIGSTFLSKYTRQVAQLKAVRSLAEMEGETLLQFGSELKRIKLEKGMGQNRDPKQDEEENQQDNENNNNNGNGIERGIQQDFLEFNLRHQPAEEELLLAQRRMIESERYVIMGYVGGCSTTSSALESPDFLLSPSTISVVLHITIILIITLTSINSNPKFTYTGTFPDSEGRVRIVRLTW